MEALKCIYSRRSIRDYVLGKEVEKELVDDLLKAACSSPSAKNKKPWEFIVIKNRDTIEKLATTCPYYVKPLKNAPLAIAVVFEKNPEDKSNMEQYKYQDCAIATQNIMLAATANGLGSCYMGGLLDEKSMNKVNEILDLPENIEFFSLISIGYSNEEKTPKGLIREEKVHYERY